MTTGSRSTIERVGPHELGPAYFDVVRLRPDLAVARADHLLGVIDGRDRIHLDLEGRVHRAWLDGVSYQRGIDGRVRRVQVTRRASVRWLDIAVLDPEAGEGVLARAHAAVQRAAGSLDLDLAAAETPRTNTVASMRASIREPLARAARWTPERYADEAGRFSSIYDPIPILPPDQNRALVVQATSGCSWNRCSFCHLYAGVRFRAHAPDELRRHTRGIAALFGRALPLRRGIFIGQANALVVEQRKLRESIAVIRDELGKAFPASRSWSLASFIDSFTRPKSVDELDELAGLGLESVALGLESGSATVLEGLGKPEEVSEAVELVGRLHASGIRCSVIVLVGAGGKRHASEHVRRTVEAITAMQPDRRDRIYLSPLHLVAGSRYAEIAREEQLGVLDPRELNAQAESVRTGLRAAGVKSPIALYDVRRFIY